MKSLFFLSLSLVRSAAKTNWRCDECNKYDRWDIWCCWPHTTRQSPGSRCCSDLQPPAPTQTLLNLLIFPTLSHKHWALLRLTHAAEASQPPAAHTDSRRNRPDAGLALAERQHDYAWVTSPLIKRAMILQIIKPSLMADSYWSHFSWEEHTGLLVRWRCSPRVFAHKKA